MVRLILEKCGLCAIHVFRLFRGDTFREDFSDLGDIRSIVPDGVHVMALTATASLSTRRGVIRSLCMQKPSIIYLAPVKHNAVYFVND